MLNELEITLLGRPCLGCSMAFYCSPTQRNYGPKDHHYVRYHRCHPYAVDVALSPGDAATDCRGRDRGSQSWRSDRTSPCARSGDGQAGPKTSGLRGLPATNQTVERRCGEFDQRGLPLYEN
jgi:hypothetical protein